jgi:hypothetical protein
MKSLLHGGQSGKADETAGDEKVGKQQEHHG